MLFLCSMFRSHLRIPKTLLWVINLFFLLLLLFTTYRIIIFFAFRPADLGWEQVSSSFILGLRYDLRWIAIVLLPIVLLSIQPTLSPFYSDSNKRYWTWYLAILTFVLFFFFRSWFRKFFLQPNTS